VEPVVLVIEHEAACPPALFGRWLEEEGCRLEVCRPYAGDVVPTDVAPYAGLLVLGGSMGAHDDRDHPWLPAVRELIRAAAGDKVPALGICLGHQLVAAALGGDVSVNPRGQQLGLFETSWLSAAESDPLFGAVSTPRRGVHWNNDLVTTLPPGASVLATTPDGELQAARFAPSAWGVQLHPEVDAGILAAWADGDRDDHLARGIDGDTVVAEVAEAATELAEAWRPLARRFAGIMAGR